MKPVSTINQIRRDIIAAYEKNPNAMLEAMTDHPQATLNQFTRSYGIQLLAEDELPVITYLIIKLRQGHDLNELLTEIVYLQHTSPSIGNSSTLFLHDANQTAPLATETATATRVGQKK